MFPSFLKGKISGRFCFSEQLECLLPLQVPGLPSPPFHPGSCCHRGSGWVLSGSAPHLPTPCPRTGAPGVGDGDDAATAWLQTSEVRLGTPFPLGRSAPLTLAEGEEQPGELRWARPCPPVPRGRQSLGTRCPASLRPQGAPARGSRLLPRERGQRRGAFGGWLRLEPSRCQPGALLPACA